MHRNTIERDSLRDIKSESIMELKLLILSPVAIIRVSDYDMVCSLSQLPHYLAQAYRALAFSEVY